MTRACRTAFGLAAVLFTASFANAQMDPAFSRNPITINSLGGTATLVITSPYDDCTMTITASSSNTNIATVSPAGPVSSETPVTFTITAGTKGAGTANIVFLFSSSPAGCVLNNRYAIPVTVNDQGSTPPVHSVEKQVIEPVSMADGAESNSWVDLKLAGPLPLYFERYYYSALQSEGQVSSALGPNWMDNYDVKLTANATSASVVFNYGQVIKFTNSGSSGWTQSSSDALAYQLTQSGTTFRMLDPGSKLVYTFNSGNGELQTISDRNGNTITLTYANGLLTHLADGAGGTFDLTYAGQNLASVTDQSGRSLSFGYTSGTLTSFTDATGKKWSYTYTGAALLASITTPRGNVPYTQTYDASGRVTAVQDANSNKFTLSYSPSTNTGTMTDPLGEVSTYLHNNHALTQEKNAAGNITGLTYDNNSRLLTRRAADGGSTTLTYNPAGLILATGYADGTRSSFTYTASQLNGFTYYDLSAIAYQDGSTENFTYDQRGNVTGRTGRNGQQWAATYNALGQPLTLTAPNGGQIVFTYSQDGTSTPATVQIPATGVYTLKADKLKRLVSRVRADGAEATFTYDAYDHLLSKTDESGAVTTFSYDANGNTASITDPSGGVVKYTRTGTDQIATATDAAGRVVTQKFDALDRLSAQVFADGSSIAGGYDAAGNLNSVTDAEGKVWKQTYDSVGNLTSTANPIGGKVALTYDTLGRLLTATSPAGRKVAYTYDALGRVTTVTDPGGNSLKFTYDKAGAPTSLTIPGGIAAQYTRDAMENVSTATDPNGNRWQFSYDALGRPLSITTPLGATSAYQRDAAGRITGQTTSLGTMALTLDPAGYPAHAQYSDGTAWDYTRDKNGRLLSTGGVSLQYDAAGRISSSNGLAITRDQLGRVSQVTLAPGKAIQYTYDRRGLCTQVKDWTGSVTTMQYDDASRLISITRPNGVVTTMTYDADNGLASIVAGIKKDASTSTLSSITLTRDGRGLVTSANRNVPASPTAAQLAAGQMIHTVNPDSQIADFEYDANGRRIADETRTYSWDLADHLKTYQASDGSSAVLTWDGTGLPVSVTAGAVTWQFVWNHALYLPSISVVRSSGSDLLYAVHAPDGQLLYTVDFSGKRRFYDYDEHGNTLFTTDDSGAVIDTLAYSEYGALISPASTSNLFTFGGRYGVVNLGSNLYAIRQRVYDASTGAFLSPDPVTHLLPTQMSPYQYANGNPLLFTDVTGADPASDGSAQVSTAIPDVISGAGNIAGTTGTELESAANATQQLVNMVDFENEGLKGAQQAFKGTKFVQKVTQISPKLNALSNVGTAATGVSIGINAYNLRNGIKAAESEDDLYRSLAQQTYENTCKSIAELYAAGKISAIQRNNLRLAARFTFEETMLNLDQALLDNLLYQGFNFFTNSMAQVPYVNDAAIALGNQFYK